MKIGRNDSCHCGSGKKYKKCCLEADAQSTSLPQHQSSLGVSDIGDALEKAAIRSAKLGDPEDEESTEYFAMRAWIEDYASQLEDDHPFEFDIDDESLDVRARINIAREHGLSDFYETAERLHLEWWKAYISRDFA